MPRLTVLALAVALALIGAGAAPAQDRARTKEVVIGLGAEPRTMLAVTIVDWTTNNMLEHIYDRLLDRDPKTFKPRPMLAESWRIVTDTTWEFKLRKGVKFHNGEPFTAQDRKSTRLNSSHTVISYAVFCLKKKKYTEKIKDETK